MKLGVAYCRVSTDKEEQKKSITEQKKEWEEFFETSNIKPAKCGLLYKKDGTRKLLSTGIYADEGISGTSLKHREAFNQMIEDAKLKKFDMIFVEDVSRFTRSVEDGIKIVKDLREIGIGVHFRKEGWDTLDQEKDFELNLRIGIAQEESRVKSERLKWAIDRLHKKGGWNCPAPFGYYRKDGYLHINEKEAEIVKIIYDLFLEKGNGIGKIARYLNENNISTKKGCKWSQAQVSTILKNEIYTGKQVTHTVETADITRKLKVAVPKEEQIVFNKEDLRIIDNETFQKAQLEYKHRNEMANIGTRHSNQHLLSSLIYCDNCGGAYKRKKRHSYVRKDGTSKDIGYEWTCAINDMYGKDRCDQRNMLIEENIIKAIRKELEYRKEELKYTLDLYIDNKSKHFVSNEDELKIEKQFLINEMKQLRKEYLEDKLFDETLYKEQLKEIIEKINNIDADLSRNERINYEIQNAKSNFNEYMNMINSINFEKLTNADLKKIFNKIIIKRRIIDREKVLYVHFSYKFLDIIEDDLEDEYGDTYYNWYPLSLYY